MKLIRKIFGIFFLIEFVASCILLFTGEFQKQIGTGIATCVFFGSITFLLLHKRKNAPQNESQQEISLKIEPHKTTKENLQAPQQNYTDFASIPSNNPPNNLIKKDLLLKTNIKDANITDAKTTVGYVETNKTIYRTDKKTISDAEIPYLMQTEYENALAGNGGYHGEILDLSFMVERDKNKQEYTCIPSYNELLNMPAIKTPVLVADILFLEYINGLPLEDPFIAQKWFYDYGLNYSKCIKKLLDNNLLSIDYACIDKLKVNELKEILATFNLSKSGNKNDLYARIKNNLSQSDLDNYFQGKRFFCATEKGQEKITDVKKFFI